MELRRQGENITFSTRGEAHEKVDKKIRYSQILDILEEYPEGLTAKEIAVKMYKKGYSYTAERNVAAPRLTELSMNGKVEPYAKTKCKYTGVMVSVYRKLELNSIKYKNNE